MVLLQEPWTRQQDEATPPKHSPLQITVFDDISDLEKKLESANFHKIHQLMVEEVERKRASLEQTWCRALKGVPTGRKVPQNYDHALHELFSTNSLQTG